MLLGVVYSSKLVRRRSFIYTAWVFLLQHPVPFFSFTRATGKGECLAYRDNPGFMIEIVAITHVLQLHSCQMRQDHATILAFGLAVHQPCTPRRFPPRTLVLGLVGPVRLRPKPLSRRGPDKEVGPRQDTELEGLKNSFDDVDLPRILSDLGVQPQSSTTRLSMAVDPALINSQPIETERL